MTAQEKFEARLKELGLYEQHGRDDHVGTFLDDGSIVVLVHIQTDPTDEYSEFHYPPFEEMWKNPRWRESCKHNFYDSDDDHFVAELAYWLDIHKDGAKCPLFPVDAYWVGDIESEWFDYEDDPEIVLCGRTWTKIGDFVPNLEVDWQAGSFTEGDLWFKDGHMILLRPDGEILSSDI